MKLICVDERLPECDNEDTGRDLIISDSLYIVGFDTDGFKAQGFGDYCSETNEWRNYGGDFDFMFVDKVTHWMPLPIAP
jgi:hypothetical protein